MPQLRDFGNPILAADLGAFCVPSIPTPPTAIAPIQVRRWIRNGKAPDSTAINRIRDAANYAVLYRAKQVWGGIGYGGVYGPVGGAAGATNVCHRFAFHSGPYTHALYITGLLYPPIASATQAKVTINVYGDAAAASLVGSADLNYGPKPSGVSFGWRMTRTISAWLDGLAPDTDYYATITATDRAQVGGMAIFDMQSLTENGNGYLGTNLTVHSPITYADRQQAHDALKAVWTRCGSHLINWTTTGRSGGLANQDSNGVIATGTYNTTISTTLTNLIDRTSTTISASTPGYTLDMTYKDRISQTSGVPCKMAVWGYNPSGDGTVVLKNSAGTTIASVTGFTSPPSWVSTTFSLPAVTDKYDLQFKANTAGQRFYVGAVSIWEQE